MQVQAQSLYFDVPDEVVAQGDTLRLSIKTADFSNIVSVQFSINWDAAVAEYLDDETADLEDVAIGSVMADNGELRLSWFDIAGNGVSLPDSSKLVDLLFLGVGDIGSMTDVAITDTPLAVQIFQDSMGTNIPLELDVDQGSITIIEPEVLAVATEIMEVLCNGGSSGSINTTITGAPENFTVSWIGPEGFTATTPDIENLSGGSYTLSVLDEGGSTIFTDSYMVEQPAVPLSVNELSSQETGCNADDGSVLFEAVGGTAPFSFDIGNGGQDSPEFANLSGGDYTLTITDGNGCTEAQRFTIGVADAPEVDLGEDLELCEGESLDLEVGTFENYIWSTGADSALINIETSGVYAVTVTDASDCSASDTINVAFLPGITLSVEQDSIAVCPKTRVTLAAFGGGVYEWFDAEGALLNPDGLNPFVMPLESTDYQVISSNTCDVDTLLVKIHVFDVVANAGPDSCIALGTDALLDARGGVAYEWLETEFSVSDNFIADPISTPTDSTFYVVRITDENDCVTIDSVNIAVATDPLAFLVPVNTITPNGDGKNDWLEFQGITKFPGNTLKIYNRWGDLVFQKVNYQKDELRFDGTYRGHPLPAGTYYYILAFEDEEFKQTLTIVRD